MNFNSLDKLSSTIFEYKKHSFNYTIYYLDGTKSEYYCSDEEHENKILKRMLEQAKTRDREMYDAWERLKKNAFLGFSLSFILFLLSFCSKSVILIIFMLFVSAVCLEQYLDYHNKFKELKKYRMYLSIMEELKKPENIKLLKELEFDEIYQMPLNISTLDYFNYNDIKFLKKELDFKI